MDQIKPAGRQFKWIVTSLLVLTPVAYIGVFLWQGPLALLHVPASISVDLAHASVVDSIVLISRVMVIASELDEQQRLTV